MVLMQRCHIDRIFIREPIASGAIARIIIGRPGMRIFTTGNSELETYHAVGMMMVREYR